MHKRHTFNESCTQEITVWKNTVDSQWQQGGGGRKAQVKARSNQSSRDSLAALDPSNIIQQSGRQYSVATRLGCMYTMQAPSLRKNIISLGNEKGDEIYIFHRGREPAKKLSPSMCFQGARYKKKGERERDTNKRERSSLLLLLLLLLRDLLSLYCHKTSLFASFFCARARVLCQFVMPSAPIKR